MDFESLYVFTSLCLVSPGAVMTAAFQFYMVQRVGNLMDYGE